MTMQNKTHITVGTHEKMKRLGYEAAKAGMETPEPTINPTLMVILSPEAIEQMKDSFAEGFYMAAEVRKVGS